MFEPLVDLGHFLSPKSPQQWRESVAGHPAATAGSQEGVQGLQVKEPEAEAGDPGEDERPPEPLRAEQGWSPE